MPSKKKKYNARFPPARIKKIMQSDEEVGKVAQVVPIIISKSLELFVEHLLGTSAEVTRSRNARTLTPTHIKTSILQKPEFTFLRDLAQTIPDVNSALEEGGDTEPGADGGIGGPVDFSLRSTTSGSGSTSNPTQPFTGTRPRSSSAANHSNAALASSLSAPTGTGRPRGRPRKRPLLETPAAATTTSSVSFIPSPRKTTTPGATYTRSIGATPILPSAFPNFTPTTVSMPASSALLGPTTSASSSSSFEALLAMQTARGGGGGGSRTQSGQLNPRASSTISHGHQMFTGSDSDTAYDNGHDEDEDEDDDEDTDLEDEEEDDLDSSGQRSSLSSQPRASVLVANPLGTLASLPPPTSTITSKDEDDDYDNL